MRAVPDEAHETVRGEPERRLGDGSCSLLSQVRPRESRAASWRTPVARCERGQLAEQDGAKCPVAREPARTHW